MERLFWCNVIGLDIKEFNLNEPNIQTIIADQSNPESLENAMKQIFPTLPDFIVDDGSHLIDHQIVTFKTLWKYCSDIYIIEDIDRKNMAKISLIPGIKQSQGIALTPQLLQSIKLFELNNLELEAYLANEILENPFLEIDQEDSLELSEDLINKSNEDNPESILDIETSQSESPIDDHSNIYDDSSKGSSNELTNIIEETISYKKSIYETLIEQVYLNFSNSIDRNIAYI